MENTRELLKSIPIFSGLTEFELTQVQSISTVLEYDQKSYVFMEGEPQEAVFFIKQGMIKTFKLDINGNEQVIFILKSGDIFPHVGFFDDSSYPATAEVIVKAQLVKIRMEDFHNLLIERPEMALKVMKILGKVIQNLTKRIQEFITEDILHRTILTLLRLASESNPQGKDVLLINAPITNKNLANMVGTSRQSINRILNQCKKNQWIEIQKGQIRIIDKKGLKKSLSKKFRK